MNTPQEFAELLRALRAVPLAAEAGGTPCGAALATITRTRGSTFRRAGARMLVLADGSIVRGLSGGCPERDIVERARTVMASGQPQLVRYDQDHGLDVLMEMGCDGELEVLVEPIASVADLAFIDAIEAAFQARRCGWLATTFGHDGGCLQPRPVHRVWLDDDRGDTDLIDPLAEPQAVQPPLPAWSAPATDLDATAADAAAAADAALLAAALEESARAGGSLESAALDAAIGPALERAPRSAATRARCRRVTTPQGVFEVLVERLRPPHALVVVGVNASAVALAELGLRLGWQVTLVDHRMPAQPPAGLPAAIGVVGAGPDALVGRVALDADTSVVVLSHALERDLAYLAALRGVGLGYLGALGSRERAARMHGEAALPAAHLHAPAGLDIGSETPEEIAVAVAAEILAVRAGRAGAPLSAGEQPIH
jgi:xanthine/CO dehydrogenase XdhC/CoxF family maturation factor